jgi:hypothetical protein
MLAKMRTVCPPPGTGEDVQRASFFGSLLTAAWGATLAPSCPAWGSAQDGRMARAAPQPILRNSQETPCPSCCD